jgi:hypothetical protein
VVQFVIIDSKRGEVHEEITVSGRSGASDRSLRAG